MRKQSLYKARNLTMFDIGRNGDIRAFYVLKNRRTLKGVKRKRLKLPIFDVAYLNEINLKGRIDAADNNMNLSHNSII